MQNLQQNSNIAKRRGMLKRTSIVLQGQKTSSIQPPFFINIINAVIQCKIKNEALKKLVSKSRQICFFIFPR